MQLKIDSSAVKGLTKKLEKLHRSALPNAVRGALNKAAFDVKQSTMPKTAKDAFTVRQANFFKANSRVEMAKGWDINAMQATVGFTSQNLKGENNYAVKDLEQQEHGGKIDGRSFIPTDQARGGSPVRPVRPGNRLGKIRNIVVAAKAPGNSDRQKFVKSVYHAGRGGYVLAEYKGNTILWKVNSIKRTSSGAFKLSPIYSFKKNRSVQVKGTGFMKKASLQSGNKLDEYYIHEAERQFNRLMK
jgi:hypothetical protein